jgi:hypothetical protein
LLKKLKKFKRKKAKKFMIAKRSQISIFIIIAVIVVIIVLSGWFAYKNYQKVKSEEMVKGIKAYADNCLKQTLDLAIEEIGLSGGYYLEPPKEGILFYFRIIPLYLYNNTKDIPNSSQIEKAISDYIEKNIIYCVRKINQKNIEYGKPLANVTISNKTFVRLYFPIIIKEKYVTKISDFEAEANLSLIKFLEIANELVELQIRHKGLCIDCIDELAADKEIKVVTVQQVDVTNRSIVIYQIYDEKYKIEELPYAFIFATELR